MSGHILCHHSQDEVWQMICKLLLRMDTLGRISWNFRSKPTVLLIFLTQTLSVRQSLTSNQISYLNAREQK